MRSCLGLALVILALGFSACKKEGAKGTVLAQVGNATLTLEELRESFPSEYEQLIRREQYLDFIKRWIDDEVLYQQALKGRLDDDPQVKRKLDKLLRKLLIEEFLARENSADAFEPDDMAMNQYYEMHREEFRRKAPEIKYASICVASMKVAADLKYKVLTDNNFLAQATTHSQDPVPESFASLTFKKQSELPTCLANEVLATRIGSNTPPIACPDGVYLVRVMERQETGSLIPFAEAKEEIAATLAMDRKDKLLDGRIATYKEGIAISYNLDQIPGLTESSTAPEAGAAEGSASGAKAGSAAAGSSSPASSMPSSATESGSIASEAQESTQSVPVRRPALRRPAPVPGAGESTTTPAPQSAAETTAPKGKSVQEENPHVQKHDEPNP